MSSQSLDKQLLDLLIASGAASADRVRELLAAGANVHAHSVGRPAIVWAARGGDVARVNALLEHGADANDPSDASVGSERPLHAALWIGANDKDAAAIVRALLAAGASPTEANAKGEVPLHLAASLGLVRTTESLAPLTALDARAADGQTALEVALVHSQYAVIERLLALGAPVDEACARRLETTPTRIRQLPRGATSNLAPLAAFVAFLSRYVDDAPSPSDDLSADDIVGWLTRLASARGVAVAQGLDVNTDVDRFQDEYGDAWLTELLSSYWLDADSELVVQAVETLSDSLRSQLPQIDDLLATLWSKYEEAAAAAQP